MKRLGSEGRTAIAASKSLPDRIVARLRRDVPLALLDVCVIFAAYLIVLVMRFDGSVPARYWRNVWLFMAIVTALHLIVNLIFGLYGQMWKYASVQEARRVVFAGACGGLLVAGSNLWLAWRNQPLPTSVVILGSIVSLLGFGAVRFQSRLFSFRRRAGQADLRRLLLVGAGDAGVMVLIDILRNPSLNLRPVAFVDDDPRKIGLSIHGVPVVGARDRIPSMVDQLKVDQVYLTIPTATSGLVREIAALCEKADVMLRVLPGVHETLGARVGGRDIRDLRIEDLLGRQQAKTNLAAVATILAGRRVLVTGAGGSIGSEIVRQVASFSPEELILLDHDETHLHDLLTELEENEPVTTILADIRDQDRMFAIFARHRPEIVFHAAALKHVPLLEAHPEEALLTNVIGSANVVDAAVAAGTRRFVMVSTDKAIHPASVMGASKRVAEKVVRSLPRPDCIFCSVRFGNVLGSRGSVVPTFLRQVEKGGPVTVTDPSMVRYFMSIQEAVQLVLQAAALSSGGEVFCLDMGEPIRIIDLARKLIQLSGRVPNRDVKIEVVGARPGEKFVEEIVDPEEESVPSGHSSIVVSRPPIPDRVQLRRTIRELEILAHEGLSEVLAGRMKELTHDLSGSNGDEAVKQIDVTELQPIIAGGGRET